MRRLAVLVALVSTVAALGLLGGAPASAGWPTPGGPLPERIDLPDGFFPEGITTGRGSTVYVGSLAGGAIWRGDVRTGRGSILVPGRDGFSSVGMDYDRRRDRLWVANGGFEGVATVSVYDAGSGRLLRTYRFEAGFLNDVVVTRTAVYATDSFNPQLAVVPLGEGGALPSQADVRTLRLTGEYRQVPGEGVFNLNGIVATRGGHTLLVVNSTTGLLYAVDARSGRAREVDLGGRRLTGGDGLELRGRTLYVVRGQIDAVSVVRLRPGLGAGQVVDRITGDLDFPSTATLAVGWLWVVNARFTTPPGPTVEYWITRLPAV